MAAPMLLVRLQYDRCARCRVVQIVVYTLLGGEGHVTRDACKLVLQLREERPAADGRHAGTLGVGTICQAWGQQ